MAAQGEANKGGANTGSAQQDGTILIGKSEAGYERMLLKLANRHGLVTLQKLAEGFSAAGVPVFTADIKGDLSGICAMGNALPPFIKRGQEIGVGYKAEQYPVVFWDLFGEQGHPVRATIAEMGPLLLARLLELNDVQEGVLNILFRYADEKGLLLLDLKDLRAMLAELGSNKALQAELQTAYGNVSTASIGTIQRQLLVLENQGAANFFGEPALDIHDFMKLDEEGRGQINVLAAEKLMKSPRLYSTYLLWMLSELFEALPEVGDAEKPKLVFFFDEAHLLFDNAPPALLESIEQVVRLIRSKGVGVYFVTQNPLDVPDKVGAQLGNRIQHALRAFTPREQKAVKAAAETFRANPKFSTADVITNLGVGEALVSTLQDKGSPSMVQKTLIAPPGGRVGPITPEERKSLMAESAFRAKYTETIDRESAAEMLAKRAEEAAKPAEGGGIGGWIGGMLGGGTASGGGAPKGRPQPTLAEKIATSAARSVASSVGRQIGTAIVRGVLGSLLGGRR
jgi:uncharacterized protein